MWRELGVEETMGAKVDRKVSRWFGHVEHMNEERRRDKGSPCLLAARPVIGCWLVIIPLPRFSGIDINNV